MIEQHLIDLKQQGLTIEKQIDQITALYEDSFKKSCVCVCSALAGEFHGLPQEVQTELKLLIEVTISGYTKMFKDAQKRSELDPSLNANALSSLLYATLQGSLNVARASNHHVLLDSIRLFKRLLQNR